MEIPPHHDPQCWGCGDNSTGIRLSHPVAEGATEHSANFRFDERHQGGPGIAHGGLVAAALDEIAGLLATWHRFPSVTARLFVRYRRAVHINRDLLLRARVTSTRGRRTHIAAELVQGDEVAADARGAWVHVPLEHFLQTPEGRAAGDAWRERLERGSPDR